MLIKIFFIYSSFKCDFWIIYLLSNPLIFYKSLYINKILDFIW